MVVVRLRGLWWSSTTDGGFRACGGSTLGLVVVVDDGRWLQGLWWLVRRLRRRVSEREDESEKRRSRVQQKEK